MDKPIIARREVTNHILHTFKLKADKRLGQNFLIDEEVVRRIVAAAELSEDDTVLEVGPGIGTLTQGLAQSGARVVAVELDKRLLPVLAKTLEGYDNVRIENGDILEVDIKNIVGAPTFKVAANLPYPLSTTIVFTDSLQPSIEKVVSRGFSFTSIASSPAPAQSAKRTSFS